MKLRCYENFKRLCDLALIKLLPYRLKSRNLPALPYWRKPNLLMILILSGAGSLIPGLHWFIWALRALICRNRGIAFLPSCRQGR